ncbi:uncharacterized protein EDB91DRAFT_164536 [Suillus paluster]|uniref:uncharacterized protein n=1 Tax=Suillus paluster TaxID=48578 RepID=UPI001B872B26|nr:uncharacterized protein EDB91DRAFT_164536 [Suillus paluster]KAG1723475.1 hypothetical protein EDB91DRAFT_164536 [Suillus paluster]
MLLSSKQLVVEDFSPQKRRPVRCFGGDIRCEGAGCGYGGPRMAETDRIQLSPKDSSYLVIDNWTCQRRGQSFFISGSMEEKDRVPLKAGIKHHILVEFCNVRAPADGDEDEMVMDSNLGVRLGGAEVID